MPGRSRVYVAQSVPTPDRSAETQEFSSPAGRSGRMSVSRKLYSPTPDFCCSLVCAAWKSWLKSLSNEDAQGKLQPIRRLNAWSFASGARDTAQSVTSWFARWTAEPLNPSAMAEQDGQPA